MQGLLLAQWDFPPLVCPVFPKFSWVLGEPLEEHGEGGDGGLYSLANSNTCADGMFVMEQC